VEFAIDSCGALPQTSIAASRALSQPETGRIEIGSGWSDCASLGTAANTCI